VPLALPPLLHIGFVVADLDSASRDFRDRWGLETEDQLDLHVSDAVFRGAPVKFSARYAFIRSGSSEIELIQPLSGTSPYSEFLASNGGDGLHHLAYVVEVIEPFLAQLGRTGGADVLLDARLPGAGRFVYVQGAPQGTVIELIEIPPAPTRTA
jgi:hypothetical protein